MQKAIALLPLLTKKLAGAIDHLQLKLLHTRGHLFYDRGTVGSWVYWMLVSTNFCTSPEQYRENHLRVGRLPWCTGFGRFEDRAGRGRFLCPTAHCRWMLWWALLLVERYPFVHGAPQAAQETLRRRRLFLCLCSTYQVGALSKYRVRLLVGLEAAWLGLLASKLRWWRAGVEHSLYWSHGTAR